MTLGEKLAELRQDKGLTQQNVADILHCASTTIAGYEQNARDPSTEMLVKYAQYFNVTTDYLLGLAEPTVTCLFLNDEFVEGTSFLTVMNDLSKLKPEYRNALSTVLKCMVAEQEKPCKKGDCKK